MTSHFAIITDPAEIANYNTRLGQHLAKAFTNMQTRTIASPAGRFEEDVYFESGKRQAARAWARPNNKPSRLVNLLLTGDADAPTSMEILVQLNFPAQTYNRQVSAVFVKDEDAGGDIFIAHRGNLTRGNGALPREAVFREFAADLIEARDANRTSKLILVSGLDATDAVDRLWQFAREARDVAIRLGALREAEGAEDDWPINDGQGRNMHMLRNYFDEFFGTSDVKGHGGGQRTVEHGDIVRALESQLSMKGGHAKVPGH